MEEVQVENNAPKEVAPKRKPTLSPNTITLYVLKRKSDGFYLNKGLWYEKMSEAAVYTTLAGPRVVITRWAISNPEEVIDILTLKTDLSRFQPLQGETERIRGAIESKKNRLHKKLFPNVGSKKWGSFLAKTKEMRSRSEMSEQDVARLAAMEAHIKSEQERTFGS